MIKYTCGSQHTISLKKVLTKPIHEHHDSSNKSQAMHDKQIHLRKAEMLFPLWRKQSGLLHAHTVPTFSLFSEFSYFQLLIAFIKAKHPIQESNRVLHTPC